MIRRVVIIAGPNGAGKTTFAAEYLPREGACPQFINADLIAAGLSPFDPVAAAVQAGRLMIEQMRRFVSRGESFAFETTLSGRRYALLIPKWRSQGYRVELVYLRLQTVSLALARIAGRVAQGGHDVPADVVRRRFRLGWHNFQRVYRPLVDRWELYDNSGPRPTLLDSGGRS